MGKGGRGVFTLDRERLLQQTQSSHWIVSIAEEVEIFAPDHFMADECIKVDDLFPVIRAIENNQDPAIQLPCLLQSQDLCQLVQRPEASGKNHQRTREVREPKLAHEKIVELEGQLAGNIGVGPLLMGQSYVETDSPSARFRGTSIRGLHDPAASARADDVSMCMRGEIFGPCGDESRELAGLLVVATERTVRSKPGGAKENDSFVDAFASKTAQWLEIFSKYAQRARVLAVHEILVLVCKRRLRHVSRFHD